MELQSAIDLVRRYRHQYRKAYIFGSVARGEQDAYSDLDLILVRNTDLPFPERARELLQLVIDAGGAELLIYTPEEFARQIEKNGFVAHVLAEAIEIEGEQEGGRTLVETSPE